MEKKPEMMLAEEQRTEAEKTLEIIQQMTEKEQRELRSFLEGVRFACGIGMEG